MLRHVHARTVADAAPALSDVSRLRARSWRTRAAAAVAATGLLVAPTTAAAHGGEATPPLTIERGLLAWSFDAGTWLGIAVVLGAYLWAVRRVDLAHPGSPVPRGRTFAWMAGLVVVLVAVQSPVERYSGVLFSVHMVQHLLLTMVAAPLLALGAPVTLLLRVVRPEVRRRVVLPLLHSRLVSVVAFPVVSWILFSGFLYIAHFSPLFDAALESPLLHQLEHALFLGTAMLFWWPVVGADPSPHRMPHPARVGYLFLGMPWSSFLGLAIFSSSTVLYPHYATLRLGWGPTAIEDQALAGGVMWAGGDLLFLGALGIAIWAWLKAEDAKGRRHDARLDRERASRDRAASAEQPDRA
ncbi:MAG: cytochrome c oxidase assembly protein [Chloroflexi bacterium]|nr:cytochrome c oxidase assembly protein [Chloroflexota bacterium]